MVIVQQFLKKVYYTLYLKKTEKISPLMKYSLLRFSFKISLSFIPILVAKQ